MSDGSKKKHRAAAFLWLLLIPLQIVIDIVLLVLGTRLDLAAADTAASGHPAPAFTLIFFFAAAIITIIVIIISVILTIRAYSAADTE